MARSSGRRDTVYEQVLDHARREIEDASAKIEELKKTLSLLEARVEASKSVYEAVAARLNLEDEGNLEGAAYPEPPPRLEELESSDEASAPSAVPASREPEAEDEPIPAPAAGVRQASEEKDSNGSGNDVSLDIIRRHLEERARRNTNDLRVSTRRPSPEAVGAEEDDADLEVEAEPEDGGGEKEGRMVGFPGLSEADRRLIEEHMRRRAEANRDR